MAPSIFINFSASRITKGGYTTWREVCHRTGGRLTTFTTKTNISKSAMCERASVRIYLKSLRWPLPRWRGSGRVSRMLSDVAVDSFIIKLINHIIF